MRRLRRVNEHVHLLADENWPVVALETENHLQHARILAVPRGITIELTHCDAAPFAGDCASLRQVLLNLFDNAVKHNHSGGWVRVALHAGPEDFVLSIENTGRSIPPELLPRIFDRFVRGPGVSEGSGLGLSITKTILVAHGATVACSNRVEGGARFAIRLPRSVPDRAEGAAPFRRAT